MLAQVVSTWSSGESSDVGSSDDVHDVRGRAGTTNNNRHTGGSARHAGEGTSSHNESIAGIKAAGDDKKEVLTSVVVADTLQASFF